MPAGISQWRLVELARGHTPTLAERSVLAADPALHRTLADLQAVDASLRITPLSPPPLARSRLLAETRDPWWRALDHVAEMVDLSPAQVKVAFGRARDGGWVHWVRTGVELFHFEGGPAVGDADVGLVRAPAEHHFPYHHHTGRERAVVLEGEVRGGLGVLRAGQSSDLPAGTAHDWWAGPEGVVLAVRIDAPIEVLAPG